MLARDTSPEIEQRQIERWRDMTSAQKLELAGGLRRTACAWPKWMFGSGTRGRPSASVFCGCVS